MKREELKIKYQIKDLGKNAGGYPPAFFFEKNRNVVRLGIDIFNYYKYFYDPCPKPYISPYF